MTKPAITGKLLQQQESLFFPKKSLSFFLERGLLRLLLPKGFMWVFFFLFQEWLLLYIPR
jgi:hypothetical protein